MFTVPEGRDVIATRFHRILCGSGGAAGRSTLSLICASLWPGRAARTSTEIQLKTLAEPFALEPLTHDLGLSALVRIDFVV